MPHLLLMTEVMTKNFEWSRKYDNSPIQVDVSIPVALYLPFTEVVINRFGCKIYAQNTKSDIGLDG